MPPLVKISVLGEGVAARVGWNVGLARRTSSEAHACSCLLETTFLAIAPLVTVLKYVLSTSATAVGLPCGFRRRSTFHAAAWSTR